MMDHDSCAIRSETAARDAQSRRIPVVLQFGLCPGCFIDEDVPRLGREALL